MGQLGLKMIISQHFRTIWNNHLCYFLDQIFTCQRNSQSLHQLLSTFISNNIVQWQWRQLLYTRYVTFGRSLFGRWDVSALCCFSAVSISLSYLDYYILDPVTARMVDRVSRRIKNHLGMYPGQLSLAIPSPEGVAMSTTNKHKPQVPMWDTARQGSFKPAQKLSTQCGTSSHPVEESQLVLATVSLHNTTVCQ